MKYENIVTWLLLGYIAWELGQRSSGFAPTCGGVSSTPTSGLTNVLQAANIGQAVAGGLGCYQCDTPPGVGCFCG